MKAKFYLFKSTSWDYILFRKGVGTVDFHGDEHVTEQNVSGMAECK